MDLKNVEESKLKTGTTIVGIVGKDYVIVAADKQTTYGSFVSESNTRKIHKISDNIVLGASGTVGDIHQIRRVLSAEIKLYETERNKSMSVKALTSFLSNILNANRYYPYFAGFLMAGYKDLPELYSSDPVGGTSKIERYTATGSGTLFALGALEKSYVPNLSKDEAKKLAVEAVEASKRRDVYSGGEGVDVFIITKKGIEEIQIQ